MVTTHFLLQVLCIKYMHGVDGCHEGIPLQLRNGLLHDCAVNPAKPES
jgi:hypothetical protein